MIPDYVMSQVNMLASGGGHVVGAKLDGRLVVLFDVDRVWTFMPISLRMVLIQITSLKGSEITRYSTFIDD